MFLLAMAHEAAKAKTFEALNDVQQLLVTGRKVSLAAPNEDALALQSGFEDLLAAWAPLEQAAEQTLDEAFEAMSRMGQEGEAVVLAQNSWTTNRAPVSDAGVDYIDHSYVAPDTSKAAASETTAAAVTEPAASSVAPVVVEAEPVAAAVAESDSAFLIFERTLPTDLNVLPATAAGPLIAAAGLGPLGAVAAGVGALALAGGGGGGGSGPGGAGVGSTVAPVNNVAVLTSEPGKDSGSVTDTNRMASGKFTVQDADAGQAKMQSQTSQQGVYGTFNLLEDGTWSYTLDPTRAAYKALPKDVSAAEKFTVKSLDDSAQKMVTVNVIGINDTPVITSQTQTGSVKEDQTLIASGQVTATDIDSGAVLTYSGGGTGTYGSLVVAADGQWTYTLNNASVQSFGATTARSESFVVTATDVYGANVAQNVMINIAGQNDAAVITGSAESSVKETNAALVIQGSFKAVDIDAQESGFRAETFNGTHGSLSITADGAWTYTAKESMDSLNKTQSVSDAFQVQTIDGTLQPLKVIIEGTNDHPTVAAPITLRVNEGDSSSPFNLLDGAFDIDSGDLAQLKVVEGSVSYKVDGGPASTIAPLGVSLSGNVLTVNPSDATFDSLGKDASKSIELTYNIQDPSSAAVVGQKATVVINGMNDLPKISGLMPGSRTITEPAPDTSSPATHVLNGTFKIADVDTPLDKLIITPGSTSRPYGSFTFENPNDGLVAWQYSISDTVLRGLNAKEQIPVEMPFTVSDGVGSITSSVDVLLLGIHTATIQP